MGFSPQGSNCQWVTISGDIQPRSVEQGLSGGHWGKSESRPSPQGAPVHSASDQWWSGDTGDMWGLCSADLQSPHCSLYWPGPGLEEAVTLSLPLPPPGSTICPGCHVQDLLPHPPPHGWPEEPEGQLRLPPGSLSNDAWAGSEDQALRVLPAELWLCQDWTLEGKSCLRTCPLLSE